MEMGKKRIDKPCRGLKRESFLLIVTDVDSLWKSKAFTGATVCAAYLYCLVTKLKGNAEQVQLALNFRCECTASCYVAAWTGCSQVEEGRKVARKERERIARPRITSEDDSLLAVHRWKEEERLQGKKRADCAAPNYVRRRQLGSLFLEKRSMKPTDSFCWDGLFRGRKGAKFKNWVGEKFWG